MKSQNDMYHGDEHISTEPQKYIVRMSEVVTYEVEVMAFDEEEAIEEATHKVAHDYNNYYLIDQSGYQCDKVTVAEPERNYNFRIGMTE